MAKIIIPNSAHIPKENVRQVDRLGDDHELTTTWVTNKKLTRQQLVTHNYSIRVFCKRYNLAIQKIDNYHFKVTGKVVNYNAALQIDLHKFQDGDRYYHASTQPLSIPFSWKGKLTNILGLNTHKQFYSYHRIANRDKSLISLVTTTFNPLQVAALYNYPSGLDGTGQTVGIIELGGGYVLSDVTTYFSMLNISDTPNITAVSVDGAVNNPSDTSGADIEVILDIEVIASLVPKAAVRVYFAPNTSQGFYDAINQASLDGCKIISISWGAPEKDWDSSDLLSYNTLLESITITNSVTVFVAAGDNGSSDGASGLNVDFPASSPYAVGCGGTTLRESNATTISQEIVWDDNSSTSATGGGISTVFTIPSYQTSLSYPLNGYRGVPDVSGNADPNTGYVLYNGGTIIVGGTSAVAPLWSGLLARINQSVGHPTGFLQPIIYGTPSVCRDITQGNNGHYSAGVGWDPCTGYGSPNGQSLLTLISNNHSAPVAAFSGTPLSGYKPLTVNFTDASTNNPTSWSWTFGDSGTSTSRNPAHTYLNAGTYTVSLTATNNYGFGTITKTNYVSVTTPPVPVASFTATPLSGNKPLNVHFTDTSSNSPTSWSWNFGDGGTNTSQNPTHTYSNAGTYTVVLIATNNSGSNSITKTNYISVTTPPIPVASFTATPLSGNKPLNVNFTDTSSNSPTSWSWNFGDSGTSTSQNPSHTYSNTGTYTVKLTATNSTGSNTLTKTNYITVTSAPSAPVASFTGSPLTGRVPLTVNFTDTSTNSPTSWSWNFGDGRTSTSENPSHQYATSGRFTVQLTARNTTGSNTLTKSSYVNVAPRAI